MITLDAPPLPAAEAARRLGRGRAPSWIASPGDDDLAVEWDFVTCDPVEVVTGTDLQALEDAWRRARRRWGGREHHVPVATGYLSYDLGPHLDAFTDRERPDSGFPAMEFRFYDAVWVRERLTGRTLVRAASEAAARRLLGRLLADGATPAPESPLSVSALESVDPPQVYLDGVARVLEYLRAGDVYQVNLARRLRAALPADAEPLGWSLFARLSREAPAPHACWLVTADGRGCLVGNSPERFLRLDPAGWLETRPIKGTRPRDPDGKGRTELETAAKDEAEHTMIVDLERNDLGRVCRTGSVEVVGRARIVELPTVYHKISTVRGRLGPGVDLPTLLKATFPGGSVTGAPKLRAMEIIAELETARRGPYTGATGWLGAAGDLDFSIAIRTATLRNGQLTLWVGGGIVVDSDPAAELAETEAKAAAFLRALS